MKTLPDSSVWIDFFRRRDEDLVSEIQRLLRREQIVVCGPVLAELLAGAPAETRDDLWSAVGHLPWADLDHDAWREVGDIGAALRQRGQWVAQTDVAIAVAATRSDAVLWTRDAHFEQIQQALPALRLYRP